MRNEIERILMESGASGIGFARIEGMYGQIDPTEPRSEDSTDKEIKIPQYPYGVSIMLAYPKEVIKNIGEAPTMEYYDAYHRLNDKLDGLAIQCETYLKEKGFRAYAQTTSATEEYGTFRTVMPHKTVAMHAGLGWIGKNALFLTEAFGSAIRLTSVLTDAPLAQEKTLPQSRCASCMLCTNACPGKAVSGRNWSPELDRDEFFDVLACRKKAREISARAIDKVITLCGKCIEVCPYTRKYLNS